MGKVKQRPEQDIPDPVTTIGRAAAAAGLSPKAVRLYEARGLVPNPERTAAGYRLYTDAAIERLRFIAAARQLGLRLDQVAEILAAAHEGQPPCATTRELLNQRIGEIDRIIDDLAAARATLTAARDASPASTGSTVCPVIESATLPQTATPRPRTVRRTSAGAR